MDLCRAGREDLEAPELRELAWQIEHDAKLRQIFAGLQRLDARIREALEEVPVPEGLSARIEAALAADERDAAERATMVAFERGDVSASGTGKAAVRGRHSLSRRVWLAGALAAAAATVAGLWWMRPSATAISGDSIAMAAREQFVADHEAGVLVDVASPPGGYPLSAQVRSLPEVRWHAIKDFVGRSGVAYQLRRGQQRASLYVVKLGAGPRTPRVEMSRLRTAPRPTSTGGLTTAVWREGDLLYVLVVQGTEAEFRQFVASAPMVT
jgi:hypothetical protein